MKKFFLISVVFSLLAFTACSSDKPTGELLPESEVSDDDIVDTDTDSTDEDTDPADSGENGNDEDTADTDTDTNDDDSGDTDTDSNDDDSGDTDTGDTDSGDTDTGDTDTGDSDTGDSDTGNTDTGDTDTGDTDTGDTDTGDTEPTEEEKCITAGGNWSASGGCTKTAQCTGKPENSEWNGDDSYTLHYTDGGWEEETAAAYNDLEAGLCRYKCNPNFLWDESGKKCFAVLGRICTNQKKCYNNKAEIDCSGSDYPGQDPYFAALGKCIQQRFEVKTPVSGQPVVIDLNTGLRWEQSYSSEQYNWGNAANHCKDLNEMNDFSGYAGYKDWRVPTVQELFTIVDSGRANPAFDGTVFTNMNELYGNGSVLWTSQDMNDGAGYYFTPNDGGNWYAAKEDDDVNVVCVSGGKMPGASFDVQENVVVDETTGLMWQRGYVSDKTWVQALEYCKKLGEDKYAGFDDWRLPNKNELASLLNLDKNTAPYSAFPDMPDKSFWSSSTFADNPDNAWFADFSLGLMGTNPKSDGGLYALCVR